MILLAMLEKLSDLRTGAGGTRPDYLCLEDSGFGIKRKCRSSYRGVRVAVKKEKKIYMTTETRGV